MQTPLNRRSFLKTAAALGGALGSPTPARGPHTMLKSLNRSGTRQMPSTEIAQLAARLGYGGVDVNLGAARRERLRPDRPFDGAQGPELVEGRGAEPPSLEEGVKATRALLARLEIKPGVVSLPVQYSRDDAVFQEGMTQLADAATFAADIGCPRMMTVLPPSSQTPKAEFRKILKDRVVAIGEVLSRSNVRLGLEFLGPLHFRTRAPHEFIWRMDEALEFARECGPNIGLTLDAWHWHHAGATAADILAAGRSRIVHVHVSDARQQPPEEVRDNQRVMPGEGVIDLVTFFQTLKKTGYTDAISPEPIGRVPKEMSAEDGARLGLETTLAAMKRAGI